MKPVIQGPQPGLVDMGIDLRGRDVRVAQHGLYRPQISPVVQKVGGEGVAQHVGTHGAGADPGLDGVRLQQPPEVLPGDGFTEPAHEQGIFAGPEGWAQLEPGPHPMLSTLRKPSSR